MKTLYYYMEMNNMMKVLLDGKEMINREMVHIYIKEKLKAIEYYGENLDALWDVLSSYGKPVSIEIINLKDLVENLGSYGVHIIETFEEAKDENKNIRFEIIDEEICN